jgi:hypothetical protein
MEVSAQLHAPVFFPKAQKHVLLGGSRTGLEALEMIKIFTLLGKEPRFFGHLTRDLDAVPIPLSRVL